MHLFFEIEIPYMTEYIVESKLVLYLMYYEIFKICCNMSRLHLVVRYWPNNLSSLSCNIVFVLLPVSKKEYTNSEIHGF